MHICSLASPLFRLRAIALSSFPAHRNIASSNTSSMSGTSSISMDKLPAHCGDLRVQIWQPGEKIVKATSSLSNLFPDGEYSHSQNSGVSIMFAFLGPQESMRTLHEIPDR